jgi:hypothetical protein
MACGTVEESISSSESKENTEVVEKEEQRI